MYELAIYAVYNDVACLEDNLFQTLQHIISIRVARGQALKMGLKLMAIFQKKVFFQTLIIENVCTLPEMQFKGIIFIGVTNFFPELVLKALDILKDQSSNFVS